MKEESRLYRVKHKPTGLYIQNSAGYTILSDRAKVFSKPKNKYLSILEDGRKTEIRAMNATIARNLDIFSNVGELEESNGKYYWEMPCTIDDFEKEYLE